MGTIVIEGKDLERLAERGKRVGENGELSGLDKRLIEAARGRRRSPQEIADDLDIPGVDANYVMTRVREIYSSRDWLDFMMQKAMILDDMLEIRDMLMTIVRNESGGQTISGPGGAEYFSFGDPRWSANLVKLLTQIEKMVRESQADMERGESKIRSANADLMKRAMEAIFRSFTQQLRREYPEVKDDDILRYMETAIPDGFAIIDSRTI